MSVENRLYALAAQCRQQHGNAFMRSPSHLVPALGGQAPDLGGEIRALGSALETDAAALIAGSANPAAEAARLSHEIAAKELLPLTAVNPAMTVAQWIGPLDGAAALHPAHSPAAQPAGSGSGSGSGSTKWVLGAAAAAAFFFYYQSTQKPEAGETAPLTDTTQKPAKPPLLSARNGPTIRLHRFEGYEVVAFHLPGPAGEIPGVVAVPAAGWDSKPGMFLFYKPGTNGEKPDTFGSAPFRQSPPSTMGPERRARPVWEADGAAIGAIQVAFLGQKGPQDASLPGSTMCISDGSDQLIGCALISKEAPNDLGAGAGASKAGSGDGFYKAITAPGRSKAIFGQ